MAGMWGYRSYRGRTPKWKFVLAVVLILVILAAICVIFLQQHIVYDEMGTPHLPLPWQEQQESPEEPDKIEVTIQKPELQQEIYGTAVPVGVLTQERWQEMELGELDACNAVAFTAKDSEGNVYFDSRTAVTGTVEIAEDTEAVLADMVASSYYTIARLACFADPKAANSDIEGMGLKNTGGYIFYDGNNNQWLNPDKEETQAYLGGLAVELAKLGFDEILLTDFSFPTEGKLDKIAYPAVGMQASLRTFLTAMRNMLDGASYEHVALSVELPAEVISTGYDEAAGLVLADIVTRVDRIYAQTTQEQIGELSEAVAAAASAFGTLTPREEKTFVPELEDYDAGVAGNYLVLK